jgi:hypothetical protein
MKKVNFNLFFVTIPNFCTFFCWFLRDLCTLLKTVLWIRIGLAVLDPDPYWECGSGSRIMDLAKMTNESGFLPFKRLMYLYLRRYVFDLLLVPTLSIFFK